MGKGGIRRPLVIGNLVHFTIGALVLLKYSFTAPALIAVWIAVLIYALFAILFGIVMFTHPLKPTDTAQK